MNKWEEQQAKILERWVNARLGASPIHGIGVFAVRDIKKGQKLYLDIAPQMFQLSYKRLTNQMPSYITEMILERWPTVMRGSAFMYPDTRFVAYMNHSDDANYDAYNDVALRDIEVGEEITENYREITDWETLYPFLTEDVVQ